MADARGKYYEKLGADTEEAHFDKDEYHKIIKEVELANKQDRLTQQDPEAWCNKSITEEEIERTRKCLYNGKSPGLDQVFPEQLKYGKEETDWRLKQLFQFCLDHKVIPDKWKTAKIISIHKKEEKRDPSNYRGISLHSYVRKMYTSFINNRVTDYLEKDTKC